MLFFSAYILKLGRSRLYRLWYRYYMKYRSMNKVFRILYKRRFIVRGTFSDDYLLHYTWHNMQYDTCLANCNNYTYLPIRVTLSHTRFLWRSCWPFRCLVFSFISTQCVTYLSHAIDLRIAIVSSSELCILDG